ncbi:CHAT domain-containing protein [Saprospira sp. CCB-QB6]|uniref:CHAT domain-containing protein n=1 Tax=Saprospira sp. CCB-QB6 TaxID=3023936 RepID=UPI00234A4127|nr:CHAT domain-containing tetratricopeptide repeat protein [Saprospira sp. CCB-QB6]WCL80579.1 CHAT domain-containing protein [Saprospira sp. CCB-QB6]
MLKKSLYLLPFLLPNLLLAQTAEEYFEQAQTAETPAAARTLYQQAAQKFKAQGQTDQYLQAQAEWISSQMDDLGYDNSRKLLEIAIKEGQNLVGMQGQGMALLHKYLGYTYYFTDNLIDASTALETALALREKTNPNDPELYRDYFNLGTVYNSTGANQRANKKLEKSLALAQQSQAAKHIIYRIQIELANNTSHLLQYKRGLQLLSDIEPQLETLEITPKNQELKGFFYQSKAKLLDATAVTSYELTQALRAEKKALQFYQACQDQTNSLHTKLYIVERYQNIYTLNKDKKLLAKCIQLINEINREELSNIQLLNYFRSAVFISCNSQNSPFQAAQLEQDIIKLMESPQFTELDKSNLLISLANLAAAQKNWRKAEQNLDKAAHTLLKEKAQVKPNISKSWLSETLHLNQLSAIIARKIHFYQEQYSQEKDKALLLKSLALMEVYDAAIDKIRKDINESGGQMAWSSFLVVDYSYALNACYILGQEDPQYLEKAFYYSERAKSFLLLQSFQAAKARQEAGLPQQLLEKEEGFRQTITTLKQDIFQYKQAGRSKEQAAQKLEKELLAQESAFRNFQKELQKDYPAYYQMQYELPIRDLKSCQAALAQNQGLLEFFVGEEYTYSFGIKKDQIQLKRHKISREGLRKRIKSYRNSIYGHYLGLGKKTEESYKQDAEDFCAQGFSFYQDLIAPLGELPERLIIVPAGALATLPFEPMITAKVDQPTNYQTHPYLVQKHAISYNYSATLWQEMKERKGPKASKELLAFAPEFGQGAASFVRGRRFALSPLTYNKREVERVRDIWGQGDIFMGQEATEDKFKALGEDYKIIHFATHGMANDQDPDFSLLAFTEIADSIENEFLYVSDIYNMQLKADLVVLSACETALGELNEGEGSISLARSFSYAGAKSIFTTLWSVNDQATSALVENFYYNLKQGMPKDKALQKAKTMFLAAGNHETSHPFLWSPYILIGDSQPIKSPSSIWGYGLGAAAVLLLGGGFLWFRRRKKQEA